MRHLERNIGAWDGRASETRGTELPLFSERRGAGEPAIVFLHGLSASGRYWHRVAERLGASGAQLHLVDLLGFGRSPWPDLAYTVDDHLAALDAWRAAAGLTDRPIVLVGHSLGTLLALEWAARTPEVHGAVLIGMPVYRDPEEARRRLARLSLMNRLTLGSRPLARAACRVMCRWRPLWRLLVPLVIRRFPPEVARDGVLHTWASFSGTLDHVIFGHDVERARGRVAALPLTIVHGDADDTAPLAAVREFTHGLQRARVVEVSGGTHDLPLTHPTLVARTIMEAIAALDGSSVPPATAAIQSGGDG